jgi:hypothetical protein
MSNADNEFTPGTTAKTPKAPAEAEAANACPDGKTERSKFVRDTIAACAGYALPQAMAANMLGLSLRQVQRKIRGFRTLGPESLEPRLNGEGRKAYNAIPDTVKEEVLELRGTAYNGIGPLQTTEYLLEKNGIKASKETLREWLIEADLWQGRTVRTAHRRSRGRRACLGELPQIDSSEHCWLGVGLPTFWLINCVDDATGKTCRCFYDADSAETNMDRMKGCREARGVPLAFCSDKASHFIWNPPKGKEGDSKEDSETQIQRALRELNVELILARSPQAKGRVERSFRTLQDRLANGMRVNGVTTRDWADAYLKDVFIPRHNQRSSVPPKSTMDAHRPKEGFGLDAIFSVQDARTAMNDNSFRFKGERRQIGLKRAGLGLKRKKALIECRLNGRMAVRFGKACYKYHKIYS